MTHRRVTLLGGSGFVGSQLACRLAEKFDEVQVLSRRAQRVRHLRVIPAIVVREIDVHDADALGLAVAGSDTVINLVGILNEGSNKARDSFAGAHATLTEKVLAACEAGGVRRYLHMSALHADADEGSSEYLRTKGAAEQQVRDHQGRLSWSIFQPSIIFGEKDAFFNRFAALLRLMPLFPLAVPEARMAPVYVGDVCQCMIDAIDDADAQGRSYPLCGPQDYSLRELVDYTARCAGLSRIIVNLPDWAARLQARIMEHVPGKPFTRDNYLSLQTPSVCDDDCVRQPTSLDAVVPGYLSR